MIPRELAFDAERNAMAGGGGGGHKSAPVNNEHAHPGGKLALTLLTFKYGTPQPNPHPTYQLPGFFCCSSDNFFTPNEMLILKSLFFHSSRALFSFAMDAHANPRTIFPFNIRCNNNNNNLSLFLISPDISTDILLNANSPPQASNADIRPLHEHFFFHINIKHILSRLCVCTV